MYKATKRSFLSSFFCGRKATYNHLTYYKSILKLKMYCDSIAGLATQVSFGFQHQTFNRTISLFCATSDQLSATNSSKSLVTPSYHRYRQSPYQPTAKLANKTTSQWLILICRLCSLILLYPVHFQASEIKNI